MAANVIIVRRSNRQGGRPLARGIRLAAALTAVMALVLVGPETEMAGAQVAPPPTTAFVYVQLYPQAPTTTQYSYIGTFWVQYRYESNSLDWWFRLAPKWVQEAGSSPVTLDFTVTTRGKRVNNYQSHTKPATYFFHSSMEEFQFLGDAWWTHHRLHQGDTVDISTDFSYAIPTVRAPGLHPVPAEHDFWAHYRVGIR